MSNQLFQFPGQTSPVSGPPRLMAKPRNRLEFYDNGPKCKKPVTQFGLVLDRDNSKHRWNMNSHILNLMNVVQLYSDIHTTVAQQRNLMPFIQYVYNNGYHLRSDAHIMVAKYNTKSGTGAYSFRPGKKDFDGGMAALLVENPGFAPNVYLFEGGNMLTFPANRWTSTPNSTHAAKLYEVKF